MTFALSADELGLIYEALNDQIEVYADTLHHDPELDASPEGDDQRKLIEQLRVLRTKVVLEQERLDPQPPKP